MFVSSRGASGLYFRETVWLHALTAPLLLASPYLLYRSTLHSQPRQDEAVDRWAVG